MSVMIEDGPWDNQKNLIVGTKHGGVVYVCLLYVWQPIIMSLNEFCLDEVLWSYMYKKD